MENEKVLIEASLKGDTEAFSALILSHEKKVYNIAFRMVGNEEDALDISQEVFLRVYKSLKDFEGSSSFSTWVYRITSNLCLDFLRSKKRKAVAFSMDEAISLSDGEAALQLPDNNSDTYRQVEEKFIKKELSALLDMLEPDYKTAVVLRDINGLSYSEICEITGCSLSAVKSRIRRGREHLKKIISEKRKHFKDFLV